MRYTYELADRSIYSPPVLMDMERMVRNHVFLYKGGPVIDSYHIEYFMDRAAALELLITEDRHVAHFRNYLFETKHIPQDIPIFLFIKGEIAPFRTLGKEKLSLVSYGKNLNAATQ